MTQATQGGSNIVGMDTSLRGRLRMARRYVTTLINGRLEQHHFRQVDTYCMFIGHARSGHSIVGALLDAHPNVILPDEVDVLQYVAAGFRRDQIFHMLLERSRWQIGKGRTKSGRDGKTYSYHVPGQWQGRFNDLRVIGSSKAGRSTRHLAFEPATLARLPKTLRVANIKVVQVVRNPFDNISTMNIRGRPLLQAIERYFSNCEVIEKLQQMIPERDLHVLRQEALIADPEKQLRDMCAFLMLDAPEAYLKACAGILYASPSKSRHAIEWTPELVAQVETDIQRFGFLDGYRYDE